MMAGRRREDSFDMVVLAMGLEANGFGKDLEYNEMGFFNDTQAPGIFVSSSCKRPMDVVSSVRDATATALKTMQS